MSSVITGKCRIEIVFEIKLVDIYKEIVLEFLGQHCSNPETPIPSRRSQCEYNALLVVNGYLHQVLQDTKHSVQGTTGNVLNVKKAILLYALANQDTLLVALTILIALSPVILNVMKMEA